MLGSLCSDILVMGSLHLVQFRVYVPASDQGTCREDKIVEGEGQASGQNNRALADASLCSNLRIVLQTRRRKPTRSVKSRLLPATCSFHLLGSSTDILDRPSNQHARYQVLHWEDSIMPPR